MMKFELKTKNHMMPFLWVHGEDEKTYRQLIKAIDEANIKCFCVESRPHEEFLKNKWWDDLSIIIDEAKNRGMTFYILDDKHFPTGYAGGRVENAPNHLRRQSVFYKNIPLKKGEKYHISIKEYSVLNPTYNQLGFAMNQFVNNNNIHFNDDELLSITFFGEKDYYAVEQKDGFIDFSPSEDGNLCLCFLTRNAGIHRNYINMLEKESVKLLIDEVYEKHYEHFKNEFGKTIVGFFSDEPEIGNSTYTNMKVDMGDDPNMDFPWSQSLKNRLIDTLGENYANLMPLVWFNGFDQELTSKVRYEYMNAVTDLVSEAFSKQIGEWCDCHNVEYIGHVIEDNGLHSKTCSSLGHYFKGLKYQTMGGIDDIGGQVIPMMEDQVEQINPMFYRDGEFYHYTLAKLATSLALINPRNKNRSMCEIFGNYGWEEGIKLEKYLLDHFMVRGVNNFVPHAFDCANYPDSDCPPHFYAFGNNPQYRHFGKLMEYGNRICSLISESNPDIKIAILYHAESQWCGKSMCIEKIGKSLYDHQIDYIFVPNEVFYDDFYNTNFEDSFEINDLKLDFLIIPECERIPDEAFEYIKEHPDKIIFINTLPFETCRGKTIDTKSFRSKVVSLDKLANCLASYKTITLLNENRRIRAAHYVGEKEFYFLVNEDKNTYQGELVLDKETDITLYDPYFDRISKIDYKKENGHTTLYIRMKPSESKIILIGNFEGEMTKDKVDHLKLNNFEIKACRSIDYPNFIKDIINDDFSGFISYEKELDLNGIKSPSLYIENAYEGVEVFINNESLGIQIVAPFEYDLTKYQNQQINLRIEVASTLLRERQHDMDMSEMLFGIKKELVLPPHGITGNVMIKGEKNERV